MNVKQKRTVEDTPGIRVQDFHQQARMVATTGQGLEGELPFLDQTLTLELSKRDETVILVVGDAPIVLNGESSHLVPGVIAQWYFQCPECQRRCKNLYRPTLKDDFACRKCHDLTYRSVLEQHRKRGLFKAVESETGLNWKMVRDLCDMMSSRREQD